MIRKLLAAAAAAAVLWGPSRAAGQSLPAEPIVLGDGRLTLGGSVSASFAPDDPGYFDYSDYEHSLLRLLRLDLTAALRAGGHVTVLGELRSENLDTPQPYALYVRLRPWTDRAFDVQIGRVPPTFGAFARRTYASDNPLIGYPLAYQYLTALRPDALPASADELIAMRGRGWLASYSIGAGPAARGVPLVSAFRWDTGVQVHAAGTLFDATGSVTVGSPSNPLFHDDNAGRQLAARLAYHPSAGLIVGASAARGAFATAGAARAVHRRPASRAGDLGRRTLPNSSGAVRGGPRRSSRLQRDHRHRRAGHLGGAGHAPRGRRRVLAAAQPDPEAVVSIQPAGRRTRRVRASQRGTAGVLVLMTTGARPRAGGLALAAALGALLSTAGAAAQVRARTGVIRGHVTVARVAPPVARRPNVAGLGAPDPRDVPDLSRSVVYLESAPRGAFEQTEPGHAVMDQRNETFHPHVLAVTTGTTVDFPNSDRIYHNVFSLSKAARFDLGRYAAGRSKSIRFDRPGIVRVFCDIHSHMNAFILVFSHPFFAVTGADGAYRIENVPPGAYSVVAWNEGVSSSPRQVTVPEGGTAEADFTLR